MAKMKFENIFEKKAQKGETNRKKLKIIADIREKNSLVISELINKNIDVELRHLSVGDYLLRGVAIERKTISDFWNSMISKRLVRQLKELKQYPKALLIIEGIDEQEIYNDKGKIHPNAIRGMILSILLDFSVPIIFTKDSEDTAEFIFVLARKLERGKKEISLKAKKKSMNLKEQLQFFIEGFPGIGPASAKKLLVSFGTIKAVINSPEDELKKIIGKKAEIIYKLCSEKY